MIFHAVAIHKLFTEKEELPLAFLQIMGYDSLALNGKEC
jgi:hypothetical protein